METTEYLVGMMYHDPESYDLWMRGVMEDYESSTGLFIKAISKEAALEWGGRVGEALLRHVCGNDTLDWKAFGYFCWVEESPEVSDWADCLGFFQHVTVGEWPNLERMTNEAYVRWSGRRPDAVADQR